MNDIEVRIKEVDYTFASDIYDVDDAYGIFERNLKKMMEEGPLYDVNIYPLPVDQFVFYIKKLIDRFGGRKVLEELWEDIYEYLYTFPDLFRDVMGLFIGGIGEREILEKLWEDIHKYLYAFPDLFYDVMGLFEKNLWMSIMGTEYPVN